MEFKSPTSAIPVTAAQYITELILINKARRQKVSLSSYFWKDKLWKKDYATQIMAANSLLKIFDIVDILETLRHKDNLWIVSLRTKGLEDKILANKIRRERTEQHIKETQAKMAQEQPVQPIEAPNVIVKPRSKNTLKNLLD